MRQLSARWLVIMLAVLTLAGCGGADSEPDEEWVGEAEGPLPTTQHNSLPLSALSLSLNATTGAALSLSALSQRSLTRAALSGTSSPSSFQTALGDNTESGDWHFRTKGRLSEELLRYIYQCAMPSDRTMTLDITRGGAAETVSFQGEIGLAEEWERGACGVDCQQWVSACVLARMNGYGIRTEISMRGSHPALPPVGSTELPDFDLFEGRFWGNLFEAPGAETYVDNRMACWGAGAGVGQITSRMCASQGGNCPIKLAGACSSACPEPGTSCNATLRGTGGSAPLHAISVFLKTPSTAVCGDGVCQLGEDGAHCPYDCAQRTSLAVHERAGSFAKMLAAAPLEGNKVVYAGFTNATSLDGLGAQNVPRQSTSRDLFVIVGTADGAYERAARFAHPGTGAEKLVIAAEPAGSPGDTRPRYIAVASKNTLRVLDRANLSLVRQWVESTSFVFDSLQVDDQGVHAVGAVSTLSGSTTTYTRQYRLYNPAAGTSTLATWPTESAPSVQWTTGRCAAYAARKAPGGDSLVVTQRNPSGDSTCAGEWSQTLAVAGVTAPTPVAIWDGVFVAGKSGDGTVAFVGRVQPGTTGQWAWLDVLQPLAGKSVQITAMHVWGQSVIVAGTFTGSLDFRSSAMSFSRLGTAGINTNADGFVAAYDIANGSLRWERTYGGTGNDAIDAFTFDRTNNLWAFGTFAAKPVLEGQNFPSTDADPASTRILVGPLQVITPRVLSAGSSAAHSLMLRGDATLWTWGSNLDGKLGDGTNTDRNRPIKVSGMDGVVSAVGSRHSMVLKADGTVWAWGFNSYGELGDGTIVGRWVPGLVDGLSGVTAIAAGKYHSVALKADGTVWTWGSNQFGQLGVGTSVTQRTRPAPVVGLTNVVAIEAGHHQTFVLKADGTVWGFGANTSGQLGDGTFVNRSDPTPLPDLTSVVALSAGSTHGAALRSDGTVWTWGTNAFGALGTGSSGTRPTRVPTLERIVQISVGDSHSLARKADGTVYAWGRNNYGQLGDGTTLDRNAPIQVPQISNALDVAAGEFHSLARLRTGEVLSWGKNDRGALGDGTFVHRSSPVRMSGLGSIKAIDTSAHTIVLQKDGTVWTYGNNDHGQLGDGGTQSRSHAEKVPQLNNITAVAASSMHSLALDANGRVWAWGDNGAGELGDGTGQNQPTPVQVVNLDNVVAISAMGLHSLALKADGSLWAWGWNMYGQLGNGTTQDSPVPISVPGFDDVIGISAGQYISLAVRRDGTVWQWGYAGLRAMSDGQRGNPTPAPVDGLQDVKSVSAGDGHILALDGSGDVWAWGLNDNGQLGNPVHNDFWNNTPYKITSLGQVSSIATGEYHSLAIKKDGTVWVWGGNIRGELGIGAAPDQYTPVRVPGLINAVDIGGGVFDSVVIKADGTAWSFGYNGYGQLGDHTETDRWTPRQALDF